MAGLNANTFEVPSWAGKPPPGLHLDVNKENKMVQKLMIDEKKCYFFGRNKQLCDFCIDHQSCSRVHAALVWHKHLNRPFIIDLGSTHGTFIGSIRLEGKRPQQVPIDSEIHFGASTRRYIIRERPQATIPTSNEDRKSGEEVEGSLLGLPETETELDNLTEFNTAHNRRIASIGDLPDVPTNPLKRKRRTSFITFNDEEEVINPEDIDPSIGRFRNLVQTTVIPSKKPRLGLVTEPQGPTMTETITKRLQNFPYAQYHNLYVDVPEAGGTEPGVPLSPTGGAGTYNIAAKLGLPMPNLAPDVSTGAVPVAQINPTPVMQVQVEAPGPKEPKKKKYAKEAWPGKKPTPSLLV